MRVISNATGDVMEPGCMLRVAAGPSLGQVWRLEHVAPRPHGDHHLHVTRYQPHIGRAHKECHPAIFGCKVLVDLMWHERARLRAAHVWSKVDDGIILGTLALVPLTFYERFHMAETIPAILGLKGGHGG